MEENIKNNNSDLDYFEDRSSEVKEILGKMPKWIIRSGTFIVFLVVIVLVFSSTVISYNDVISAEIYVTTKNPPIYLKANTSGKLKKILVEANQSVDKGEILAEIENTASLRDILFLKKALDNFQFTIIPIDSIKREFPPFLEVGELQLSYGEFLSSYQKDVLFNTLTPNEQESQALQQQLIEQTNFLKNQIKQSYLSEEDLRLSEISYTRNLALYKKGVLSKAEFENISRTYLTDKQKHENFLNGISNSRIAIANFNNLISKSEIQGTEFKTIYKQQLEKDFYNLKEKLLIWEQKYLLKSPIKGKVTLFDIWSQYQNVISGETLFTVIPKNSGKVIGRVILPIKNSGKVKVGQKVIVKLSNYPHEEWGSLEGVVANISEVPKQGEDSYYTLFIEINSLKTSYNKEIKFKQEMKGVAEIIIEELSIFERIFYQFRKIFNTTS